MGLIYPKDVSLFNLFVIRTLSKRFFYSLVSLYSVALSFFQNY